MNYPLLNIHFIVIICAIEIYKWLAGIDHDEMQMVLKWIEKEIRIFKLKKLHLVTYKYLFESHNQLGPRGHHRFISKLYWKCLEIKWKGDFHCQKRKQYIYIYSMKSLNWVIVNGVWKEKDKPTNKTNFQG